MIYRTVPGEPFAIFGLHTAQKGNFSRLPEEVTAAINENAANRARNTTGACVRFRTDAERIAIRMAVGEKRVSPKMPLSQKGCDVWFDGQFGDVLFPTSAESMECEGEAVRPHYLAPGVHQVQINLPIFNSVIALEIGTEEGTELLPPAPYTIEKQVVFYGSSITQGLCSSRPGNTYCAMLSRRLDFPLYDLGFGSGARGEQAMAKYIASLPMSAFVLDYDHNEWKEEELAARHEPFFQTVRTAQPALPILILSRPDFEKKPNNPAMREIVRRTYENAAAAGDKNVYFIDGETFFGTVDRGSCTIDGVHPNDLGMRLMADTIYPVLEKMLYPNGRNDKR